MIMSSVLIPLFGLISISQAGVADDNTNFARTAPEIRVGLTRAVDALKHTYGSECPGEAYLIGQHGDTAILNIAEMDQLIESLKTRRIG